jgi:hypothetical protein
MHRRILIALILTMSAWSLTSIGRELFVSEGLVARTPVALSRDGATRIGLELESIRPGSAKLYGRLATELPPDALLFGLHPGAGDADQEERIEAVLLLGELQLLLFPLDVRPMPGPLAGPRNSEAPPFVPPAAFGPLAAAGKLFALDLGYPYPERIEAFMAPRWAQRAGVLWGPR